MDKNYIVIGIGGKTKIQRWDIEKYADVLNKCSINLKIIILGGKDEIDDADKLNKLSKKQIINLCGKTNILESAYILSKAKIYFGNDTGTLHLASIVGTKCLVISSARNNIGRWDPYGNNHTIIRTRIDCEGCWLHADNCKKNIQCMTDIQVSTVVDSLKKSLND